MRTERMHDRLQGARAVRSLAEQYPYTVYAITPGGHRFAVATYQSREAADAGAVRHQAAYGEDTTEVGQLTDRPLAASGLTSYRYRGRFGWVMIGATDHADALREAARSVDGPVQPADLQVWDGRQYCQIAEGK